MKSDQVTEELPTQNPHANTNAVTEEYPAQQPAEAPAGKPRKGRFWRELTGALSAGLVIVAFAVLVLQIISWANGVPGLGVIELIGHIVAAGLALYAQRVVQRRPGRPALIAGLGIGVIVLLVLVLFWWI